MKTTKEINSNILEGRLLLAALVIITTESRTDQDPDQVLEAISELEYKMRLESAEKSEALELKIEKLWPESSQVARTRYYPKENILEVEFKGNGKVYHYSSFPQTEWTRLFNCDSIGSFINKEVKGKYEYGAVIENRPVKVINLPDSSDL